MSQRDYRLRLSPKGDLLWQPYKQDLTDIRKVAERLGPLATREECELTVAAEAACNALMKVLAIIDPGCRVENPLVDDK